MRIFLTILIAFLSIGATGGARDGDGLDGSYLTIASSTDFDAEGTVCISVKSFDTWGVDGGSGGTGTQGTAIVWQRGDASTQNNGTGCYLTTTDDVTCTTRAAAAVTATCSSSTDVLLDRLWHRFCWVYEKSNGGTNTLYVDGASAATCVNSAAWDFNSQVITLYDAPSNTFWEEFDGYLANFAWYEFQMTDAQVLQEYRNWCSFNNGTNTALCMPIYGTESPEKDLAGTGKTATVTGTGIPAIADHPQINVGGL